MVDVTPCMGVWIETDKVTEFFRVEQSHPVWVCGLKQTQDQFICEVSNVTPCMGVWIETQSLPLGSNTMKVTPCMGVWIETKGLT